jgi:hypothetical protein
MTEFGKYDVFDENAETALKELGELLGKHMPKGYGFVLVKGYVS